MQFRAILQITGLGASLAFAALAALHPVATQAGAPRGDATGDYPGRHHMIRAQDLPEPFATGSVGNGASIVERPEGFLPDVPEGFAVNVFAENLGNWNSPRMMATAPNGDIFTTLSGDSKVLVLRDTNKDGVADRRFTFATRDHGLVLPFGLAFRGDYLYVANTNTVLRFPYQLGQTKARGRGKTLIKGIPGFGYNQHWTRNITFNADKSRLYLSVGSQSNLGVEPRMRAAVHEYRPDGTGYRRVAWGIRNPVGLAVNPVGGALWATCNERDGMGDDLVPDYFTEVKQGGFYGWPWFYIGANPQPDFARRPDLAGQVLVPDVLLRSHSASLGCLFYTGTQFPAKYRNDAFIALHGSWNRGLRTGYKVVRVRFQDGHPVGGYEDFMTGFMVDPNSLNVYGRPVGLTQAADGSLLVSDDGGRRIWRVRWEGS